MPVFIIPVYDDMPSTKVSAPSNKSTNSYLNSIKINNELIEGFSYDKFNYTLEVDGDISGVDVSVGTVNSNAKVKGTGTVKLNDGENKISIVVTAENGNVTTYNLVINKQSKKEDIVLSGTNSLKALVIDKIDFKFSKDTLEYNLKVPFDTEKISISYELEDSSASVDGDSEVKLIVGLNKVNIVVTAENGNKKTYVLNITREEININGVLNKSGIKYNDKYMYGIKVNTSTSSLIDNIKKVSNSISVVIKDKDNKVKSGVFATGDKVIIDNGTESKTYEILIYGDVNGDGLIDKLDYLAVLRHYYKYKEYTGVYKEAADVNRDKVVDKLDYLAVLRDYYGYKKIEQ